MDRISVDGKRFIDQYGRHRIFNGINHIDKICEKYIFCGSAVSFVYATELNKIIVEKCKEWGFNVIRFGISWSAVEPEPNKYNEAYIDGIAEFLDICYNNGIYAYIDMHQDIWNGVGHVGDGGAPDWACITNGKKYKKHKFVWSEGYFWDKAIQNSFENFWLDAEVNGIGLQTYYCNMWMHVIDRIKDKPSLLGFDLFNEPHNGCDGIKTFKKLISNTVKTVFTDKRCNKSQMLKDILSGHADKVFVPFENPELYRKAISSGDDLMRKFDEEMYSPFINKLAKVIRSVTDKGIILFENGYFSNIGIPCSVPPISIDGVKENNQCFSPHIYDIPEDTGVSNTRTQEINAQRFRDQERLDVPVMVGEWGQFGSSEHFFNHAEFMLSKFDEYQWSQTYYCFVMEFIMSHKSSPLLDILVRPHPIAVCGDIDYYRHDRENNSFTLKFTQDKEYDVPTILYAHKEIDSVETDGEYRIIPIENSSGSNIEIKTHAGEHAIVVKFK